MKTRQQRSRKTNRQGKKSKPDFKIKFLLQQNNMKQDNPEPETFAVKMQCEHRVLNELHCAKVN